jgi:hypothetical protein
VIKVNTTLVLNEGVVDLSRFFFTVINEVLYPLSFKIQVSVGTKNNVGKALSLRHGYSLTKVNNGYIQS